MKPTSLASQPSSLESIYEVLYAEMKQATQQMAPLSEGESMQIEANKQKFDGKVDSLGGEKNAPDKKPGERHHGHRRRSQELIV